MWLLFDFCSLNGCPPEPKFAHINVFEGAGFERVQAPEDFPENMKPMVVFMECDLSVAILHH